MLIKEYFHRFLAMSTALLIFFYAPCLATTIVAIRTPEVFVIAADSAATFKGGGKPAKERSVSKILQKSGVLYAISGLTKDPSRGFDPENIIGASLSVSQPLHSTVANLEAILSEALRDELLKLQKEEPVLFRDAVEGDNGGMAILLASFDKGQIVAIGMQCKGAIDSDGKVVVRTNRVACPGDCLHGTYTFLLGERKAIDKYFAEPGRHFPKLPEEAVRFMVQLEIDAKTPGVAPPIDVVRLDKGGITWLSRGGRGKQ